MTQTTEIAAVGSPAKATAAKKRSAKATATKTKGEKKPAKPAEHPPVAEMVLVAITTLKARNGSSLQAIKKYIGANYKADVAKLAFRIRKALVKGVEKGTFSQRKGTGATGSFKLTVTAKKSAGEKKKPVVAKKAKAGAAKPTVAATKKKPTKKEEEAAAKTTRKSGSPKQKATKPSKTAAAVVQPKAPKPKKTGAKA